ncbi:iron chelate uptake ABC transporter family permease subunit [Acetobacterium fimetarium]|uniref:Iron chelate uptake ABC transporter family permease subunit n=1 Tax=Acetobacterium fimetarium TaxID=52691 RepID=A0ABR6WXX6_9FIRM|nr:iron ABC transporter permease [Acetobacterium fimetarium]MBC3805410.1 iron chelate uptake ABC transporter family permease subunit [Acetobacterium fimetarium]
MNTIKTTTVGENYNQYVGRKYLIILALAVMTFLMALYAISAGSADIPVTDVMKALLGLGAPKNVLVTVNIRLPRILMAITSGVGLAAAGCVMQSILKNPLASASTLGISQGASFGAAIAIIYFGGGTVMGNNADAVTINNPYVTSICAFIASMFVTFVILGLSKARKASPETMILAGVALSSFFAGGTALLQYFSSDVQMAAIVFWTFGDLGRASISNISIAAVVTLAALIYFMFNRWNYNALECGEHTATGLGVNVSRVRLAGMTIASLSAATIVSFVGIINFIGLIAPHIMRRFVGNDYRFLLPASALMGALLLLVSDTFARLIISPVILPIGAITSFLGAPLFLYLIFKGVGHHAES